MFRAEVSGVIPLANVQGCSGAGLGPAALDQNHGIEKTPWETPIVLFGMLGIFPIYPDISKNCFWPGFFVDGNAFSNLWFRKVAKVLEGSGGICKVGVLQQI